MRIHSTRFATLLLLAAAALPMGGGCEGGTTGAGAEGTLGGAADGGSPSAQNDPWPNTDVVAGAREQLITTQMHYPRIVAVNIGTPSNVVTNVQLPYLRDFTSDSTTAPINPIFSGLDTYYGVHSYRLYNNNTYNVPQHTPYPPTWTPTSIAAELTYHLDTAHDVPDPWTNTTDGQDIIYLVQLPPGQEVSICAAFGSFDHVVNGVTHHERIGFVADPLTTICAPYKGNTDFDLGPSDIWQLLAGHEIIEASVGLDVVDACTQTFSVFWTAIRGTRNNWLTAVPLLGTLNACTSDADCGAADGGTEHCDYIIAGHGVCGLACAGQTRFMGSTASSINSSTNAVSAYSTAPADIFEARSDNTIWWTKNYITETAIPGGRATAGTQIAATARTTADRDIFYIDPLSQRLSHAWWNSAFPLTSWGTEWLVPPSYVLAPNGAAVTAVARDANHLDIFVVGNDSRLHRVHWDSSAGWSTSQPAPGVITSPGSGVASVAATNDTLDVFFTESAFGAVEHVYIDERVGSTTVSAIPGALTGIANSRLAAVARQPDLLDVFSTDSSNRIRHDGYNAYTTTNGGWSALYAATGLSTAAPNLSAVATNPKSVDLFWVGSAGITRAYFDVSWGSPSTVYSTSLVAAGSQLAASSPFESTPMMFAPVLPPHTPGVLWVYWTGSAWAGTEIVY